MKLALPITILLLGALGILLALSPMALAVDPPPFNPGPPNPIPVDGGASLLLAAGAGLGWRKLRRMQQARRAR